MGLYRLSVQISILKAQFTLALLTFSMLFLIFFNELKIIQLFVYIEFKVKILSLDKP